ncbi:MAG: hypothetical protein AB9888_15225 [Bacteroidales bacterium]
MSRLGMSDAQRVEAEREYFGAKNRAQDQKKQGDSTEAAKATLLFAEMLAIGISPPVHTQGGKLTAASRSGFSAFYEYIKKIGKLPSQERSLSTQKFRESFAEALSKFGLAQIDTKFISLAPLSSLNIQRCDQCSNFLSQDGAGHKPGCNKFGSSDDASPILFQGHSKGFPAVSVGREGTLSDLAGSKGERRISRDIFKNQAMKAGWKEEEVLATLSLMDGYSAVWALETGLTPDNWYARYIAGVVRGGDGSLLYQAEMDGNPMFQETIRAKGAVQFLYDGRALIYGLNNPDVSTLAHEIGHVFRRGLSPKDNYVITRWLKKEYGVNVVVNGEGRFVEDGKRYDKQGHALAEGGETTAVWAEERFARGFERYLAEGNAPNRGMRSVFGKFKIWLGTIYQGIKGTPIDVKLNKEIRALYERMLVGNKVEKESVFEKLSGWFGWSMMGPFQQIM